MSLSRSMWYFSIARGRSRAMFRQAKGSIRLAVPTSTAVAPHSIISITSSAVLTPPMPTIGILTASYTCQTILRATGLTAGPLKPPVTFCKTGFRVLRSTRRPISVLIRLSPSAPSASHARAMAAMSVTLGDSLTISGFSVGEYAETCAMLDASPQIGWLEVNISCPNVHGGGMSFGTDPAMAAEVTRRVKAVTTKPVLMKLSPNVTNIVEIAKACEDAGADGLSLINTIQGMRIDLRRRKPVLANTFGGLSGPAILPVALRMVYQVYEAVKIPIVGMGGVSTAEDVVEMMLAGAAAVQIGAVNLVNPFAGRDIVNDLPAVMEKYGIQNLSDCIGGAH